MIAGGDTVAYFDQIFLICNLLGDESWQRVHMGPNEDQAEPNNAAYSYVNNRFLSPLGGSF